MADSYPLARAEPESPGPGPPQAPLLLPLPPQDARPPWPGKSYAATPEVPLGTQEGGRGSPAAWHRPARHSPGSQQGALRPVPTRAPASPEPPPHFRLAPRSAPIGRGATRLVSLLAGRLSLACSRPSSALIGSRDQGGACSLKSPPLHSRPESKGALAELLPPPPRPACSLWSGLWVTLARALLMHLIY